jgi:transposase InsO family protein
VAWLCKQLSVALSGFYAWRQRQQNPSPRVLENAVITAQVQTVFERHRCTTAGWWYLAVWIDLYSRRVVGWAMGATMEATLVLEALNRALGHRQIKPDQLLIHTDQGSQ